MADDPAARARLHAAWAHQLSHEYDGLLFRYGLRLTPPSIGVLPMAGRWGSWDPTRRALCLSVALVEGHSWDVVLEVLKHEVAHQLVSEHFHSDEGHGPLFARACRMLGVLPWAAAASGALPPTLPQGPHRALSEAQERLLKKVQKLLALAASSNEHEAGLAMQRVREITARHRLDTLTAAADDDVVHQQFCRQRRRSDAVEGQIFVLLMQHFFVRAIHCTTYDAVATCTYRAVEIVGRREHVAMAAHVYHFLHQQLEALWRQHVGGAAAPGRVAKTSFRLGILAGFGRTLAAAERAAAARDAARGAPAAAAQAALVRRDQPAVNAYLRRRHPRLRASGASNARHDPAAYRAGQQAGGRLTLRRPLTEPPAPRPQLLRGRS